MKISGISLKNFAAYDNVSVSFAENITYLVGKSGSGKSTIGINAVHFILQGIAEKSSGGNIPLIGERFRFIGDKGKSAIGELTLRDEVKGFDVKVIRKLTKSGSELTFEAPEGMELNQEWLNDLFNIFMIAPKRFTELSGKEQAIALGIDTSAIDAEIAGLKIELTGLNRDYKQFENLTEFEKFEKVEIADLEEQKSQIKDKLNKLYIFNKEHNKALEDAYKSECDKVDEFCTKHNNEQVEIDFRYRNSMEALKMLLDAGYAGNEVAEFITDIENLKQESKDSESLYPLPVLPFDYEAKGIELQKGQKHFIVELPDDSEMAEIDKRISDAAITNEKALLYAQYLERLKSKEAKELEIKTNKQKQGDKEVERLEKIKSYKFPFDNLSVNESGELELNGRPIKPPYYSTGQLLKIVPKLMATTNPELKYIFLQDFNLMDEDLQADIESDLTAQGFQLVIEYVGKKKLVDKNCILLKDGNVVDSYEEVKPTNNL